MGKNRDDLFALLARLGITTETVEHAPVFTVEESQAQRGRTGEGYTKNLFLKDKKGQLWLVVAREDAAIDLKRFHTVIGSARLSFARPELMRETLAVEPGSVTPFAVINDEERRVRVVLDAGLMRHETLKFHPLVNSATTVIGRDDLLKFLEETGHRPVIVDVETGTG